MRRGGGGGERGKDIKSSTFSLVKAIFVVVIVIPVLTLMKKNVIYPGMEGGGKRGGRKQWNIRACPRDAPSQDQRHQYPDVKLFCSIDKGRWVGHASASKYWPNVLNPCETRRHGQSGVGHHGFSVLFLYTTRCPPETTVAFLSVHLEFGEPFTLNVVENDENFASARFLRLVF